MTKGTTPFRFDVQSNQWIRTRIGEISCATAQIEDDDRRTQFKELGGRLYGAWAGGLVKFRPGKPGILPRQRNILIIATETYVGATAIADLYGLVPT